MDNKLHEILTLYECMLIKPTVQYDSAAASGGGRVWMCVYGIENEWESE